MSIRQDDLDLLSALTVGLPDSVSDPSHPPEPPVSVRFAYIPALRHLFTPHPSEADYSF